MVAVFPQYMFELLNNKLETHPRRNIARLTMKNVIDDLGMLKEDGMLYSTSR